MIIIATRRKTEKTSLNKVNSFNLTNFIKKILIEKDVDIYEGNPSIKYLFF